MGDYLVTYIEDNEYGVYVKEILEKAESFEDAYMKFSKAYPTMFGLKQVMGQIDDKWRNYYSHESQDQLQKSRKEMAIALKSI